MDLCHVSTELISIEFNTAEMLPSELGLVCIKLLDLRYLIYIITHLLAITARCYRLCVSTNHREDFKSQNITLFQLCNYS